MVVSLSFIAKKFLSMDLTQCTVTVVAVDVEGGWVLVGGDYTIVRKGELEKTIKQHQEDEKKKDSSFNNKNNINNNFV